MSKRQLILRYGAWVWGLAAATIFALSQAHFFSNPKFARLRPAFIVLDIFMLAWVLFMVFTVWKLSQKDRRAEKAG